MAAATTPSPSTGTIQLVRPEQRDVDAEKRIGVTRATAPTAIAAAPTTIPPQVSTTGGTSA